MKFKLNKLEKFAIRHYTLLVISFFIVLTAYIIIFANFEVNADFSVLYFTIITIVFMAVAFPIAFLLRVFANKTKEVNKLSNVEMDIYSAIDACNQMLAVINPKSVTYITIFCIHRIVCLINLGDFDAAENEIRLFWQHINLKKVNAADLAATHMLMANIALSKENYQLLNEEMRLVNEYRNNAELVGLFKRAYNYNLTEINLLIEAHCADINSNAQDFEARVFAHLNIDGVTGKPRKKQPEPIHLISAYNPLFIFYKRKGDIEKTRFYAAQIVNIGNEQLFDYRRAKEYLENENRSN